MNDQYRAINGNDRGAGAVRISLSSERLGDALTYPASFYWEYMNGLYECKYTSQYKTVHMCTSQTKGGGGGVIHVYVATANETSISLTLFFTPTHIGLDRGEPGVFQAIAANHIY